MRTHAMSLQEIEQAIAELPEHERAELVRRISRLDAFGPMGAPSVFANPSDLPGGVGDGGHTPSETEEQKDELIRRRRELAEAAAPYWQGGDGLDYQLRIRAEWDDRPGFDG